MAALGERLQAEASCSVCLELFSEPVLTECGHSFCRRCLSALLEAPGAGGAAACPQCRAPLGPGSLRPNRALGAVAELAAELEAEAGRPRCRQHGEALGLFCESCRCPLCPRCWDEPAHRQHPARPAGEAAQRLREMLQSDLVLMQKEKEDLKSGGEKQSDVLLSKVALERQRLRDTFEELQQFLQEQKEVLLAQLAQAHEELAKQRSHYVSRASERRSLLDRVIAEIEKKRDQPAAEFLMDVGRTLSSCEAAKVPVPEPVSAELQRQVGSLCELSQLLAATVANFRVKVLSEMDRERVKVTLDPETMSPDLVLSEDCRSVRLGEGQQNLPSTPKRFLGSPSVLGSQGFTSGRHYWEVEVGNGDSWAVGVALGSVGREESLSTAMGKIWALRLGWDRQYTALHAAPAPLALREQPRRIRVHLDCDAGRVTFHNAESMVQLLQYQASFTEEVFPYFWLWSQETVIQLCG